MSTTTYVDPSYGKATYRDIVPVASRYRVSLNVQRLKNGEPIEQGKQQARSLVESTLWATGVFDLSQDPSAPSLLVVIDNFSRKSAAAKGFATAISLGAVGVKVTDYYNFAIEYVNPAGKRWRSDYQRALYTVVGNKKLPENAEPTTPTLGFATIVEQVMLNVVEDLQKQGMLSREP